jgi:Uncharacterised nucleotidyltransferase
MFTMNTLLTPNPLSKDQLIRETVLLMFRGRPSEQLSQLQNLSHKDWRKLLRWLDISGLALYFLDRMRELRLCGELPSNVLTRLQQNLHDNTERTRGMIAESARIHHQFQKAGLTYATLKGLSLYPDSVPKSELRHQFDLDFLLAENSASAARQILEGIGYHLHAISGRSWEFKVNERPNASIKDLYKDLPGRSVELHIEANTLDRPSLLGRTIHRELYGINMPVLSPVDLFLGQGLHVYKHVCSEFSRTAHLLEFYRHVLHRRDDNAFWDELRSEAEGNPRACLGLGIAVLLTTHIMGDFAPKVLTNWTVARLPESARLWVKIYGRRTVFGNFPGSKLYLLLQKELESSGISPKRSLQQSLLPRRLPPPAIRASANDTLSIRIRRYRMQLYFVFVRLRFHIMEGLRYLWESYRWRRHVNRAIL